MLPTNEKAPPNEKAPLIIGKTKILFNNNSESSFRSVQDAVYQHLYILSDDEIKEKDWYFKTGNKIIDNTFIDSKRAESLGYLKIIASTNSSLALEPYQGQFDKIDCTNYIPSIPKSFIDKYISEYNKENKIEECLVEYQMYNGSVPITYNSDPNSSYTHCELILDSNNTINVKSIKDNWTKEELNESAMYFYNKHHGILNQSDIQSISKFIDELI